jgi:hypothetical protein
VGDDRWSPPVGVSGREAGYWCAGPAAGLAACWAARQGRKARWAVERCWRARLAAARCWAERERLLLQQLGHCRVGLEMRMDEGKKDKVWDFRDLGKRHQSNGVQI